MAKAIDNVWPYKRKSCLEWQGLLDKDGYGRVKVDGESKRAHRAMFEVFFGVQLAQDQVLLHSCDNPRCFSPFHLTIGTQADNVADMDAKGRRVSASSLVTHCPAGHAYDRENTLVYRDGKRRCKTCREISKKRKP